MDLSQELIDSLYRDKIECARMRSIEQKFRDGLELFDLCCHIMADGIRMQNPGIAESRVQQMVRDRLELLTRMDHAA